MYNFKLSYVFIAMNCVVMLVLSAVCFLNFNWLYVCSAVLNFVSGVVLVREVVVEKRRIFSNGDK